MDAILELKGVTKRFGGLSAVKNVSLELNQGEILFIIGPNGAGKTTVFNLLTRFLDPTAGTILFKGEDITRVKPADYAKVEAHLREARRVLNERGTLYFHIDYREAHYCKVLLLDPLFGRDGFLNEVIWAYDYGARTRRRFNQGA